MALNLEKLRQRQEELQKDFENGGGGEWDFWSCKDGRNVIRLLPPLDNMDDAFYVETIVHFSVGPNNKMTNCRKMLGANEPCPVCEYIAELKKSGSKEDKKLAEKMGARTRVYYNIVDREEMYGDDGLPRVRVYGSGKGVFKDLLSLICDPEWGDITDVEVGHDVIIEKSGTGLDTEYSVKGSPSVKELGFESWWEYAKDLVLLKRVYSYDNVCRLLNGEDPVDDDNEQTPAPRQAPAARQTAAPRQSPPATPARQAAPARQAPAAPARQAPAAPAKPAAPQRQAPPAPAARGNAVPPPPVRGAGAPPKPAGAGGDALRSEMQGYINKGIGGRK